MTNGGTHTAETPDDDPRESDDYEAQWQDLDPKVIQVQILMELQQIRMALTGTDGAQGDSATVYRCGKCNEEVPESDRARHAQKQHKAPPGMVDSLFVEVEG